MQIRIKAPKSPIIAPAQPPSADPPAGRSPEQSAPAPSVITIVPKVKAIPPAAAPLPTPRPKTLHILRIPALQPSAPDEPPGAIAQAPAATPAAAPAAPSAPAPPAAPPMTPRTLPIAKPMAAKPPMAAHPVSKPVFVGKPATFNEINLKSTGTPSVVKFKPALTVKTSTPPTATPGEGPRSEPAAPAATAEQPQAAGAAPAPPTVAEINTAVGTFKFYCPACQQKLGAKLDWQGRSITCPACNTAIIIPSLNNS